MTVLSLALPARFFGRHKEYMQCLTRIIGLNNCLLRAAIEILETQGIDFDALMLLTDSKNVKTPFQ